MPQRGSGAHLCCHRTADAAAGNAASAPTLTMPARLVGDSRPHPFRGMKRRKLVRNENAMVEDARMNAPPAFRLRGASAWRTRSAATQSERRCNGQMQTRGNRTVRDHKAAISVLQKWRCAAETATPAIEHPEFRRSAGARPVAPSTSVDADDGTDSHEGVGSFWPRHVPIWPTSRWPDWSSVRPSVRKHSRPRWDSPGWVSGWDFWLWRLRLKEEVDEHRALHARRHLSYRGNHHAARLAVAAQGSQAGTPSDSRLNASQPFERPERFQRTIRTIGRRPERSFRAIAKAESLMPAIHLVSCTFPVYSRMNSPVPTRSEA